MTEKPPTGPEMPPESETPEEIIESDFEKTFGIKNEELESIEDYKDLSVGQRALVLGNLKQLTLGRIEDEAVDRYTKETADSKFLGRIWRSAFKKYGVARAEKTTAEEILHSGMALHGETLANLVKGMAESGPEAAVKETGGIEIFYAGKFENLTEDEQRTVSEFNTIARRFATIPQEWSLPSATKKQQKEHEETKAKYEEAIIKIMPLKEKSFGNERDAALAIADIERKVLLDQLLSQSPNVERRLKDIESNKVWAQALKNIVTERGTYMGFGYVTRAATTSVLGVFAAPAVAAIVGGHIARRRALETLREQEKLGRRGAKEEKAEIAKLKENAKTAKVEYQEAQKAGDSKAAKLALQNVSRIEATLTEKQKGEKAFVNAAGLDTKLEYLLTQLNTETDDTEKAKVRGSIQARIDYTHDKLNKGLVNFGKTQEQLAAKYGLLEALARAEAEVAVKESELQTAKDAEGLTITERLDRLVGAREAQVAKVEKRFVRDQMVRGMIIGATFAALGYAIRHFFWGAPKQIEPIRVAPPEAPDTGTPFELRGLPTIAAPESIDAQMARNLMAAGMDADTLLTKGIPQSVINEAGSLKVAPMVPLEAVPPSGTGITPEQLALGTIKKGEGVWHAVYHQLEDQLKKAPSKFNLESEDLNDAAKIKSVLNKETLRILVENKIIKPDGTEIRIGNVGAKVILGPDNTIKITGGKTYEWTPPKTPVGVEILPFEIGKTPPIPIEVEAGAEVEAGVDPQLVHDTTNTFGGMFRELNSENFPKVSLLEQEEIFRLAGDSASRLDKLGITPGTGGSFRSQLEQAIQQGKIAEAVARNNKVLETLAKKISSFFNLEWDKVADFKMAEIVKWSGEPREHWTPQAYKFFKNILKLKPSEYEMPLTFEEFVKNRIIGGKSEIFRVFLRFTS